MQGSGPAPAPRHIQEAAEALLRELDGEPAREREPAPRSAS